ncbi:helix-turn-helix domain-containing protein [Paenibacillus sp. MWE-103]|uniref:Helix-turn-helix domain-containing protein n=1 Tax=Paenibacillus artemisiicola TaxID=1172618 RepID=A0ABS3WE44_9BACL|nr:helix-turn-helix domain-containing protein [Paenibacillus artemisiicola]MBO7746586.1 helix-turn-helix domain-containing protein [Paenibacillus artemisiicola]
MSDLGALLKKAREQRSLSLDDIQDLTKIRKRYLEAIEEGNYSVLPGSFYVRAFVKNYAESVGLDAEEVLRLYNKEIPSSVPEQPVIEPVQRPRRSGGQSHTSDRISRWGFRALMWSFLLLIIVLVYIFAIKQPSKENVDSADQTKMTDETTPPPTNPEKGSGNNGGNATTGGGSTNGGGASNGSGTNGTGTDSATPPDQQSEGETTPPPTAPTTTLTLDRTSGTTDYYNVSPGGTHKIEMKSTGHAWVGIYEMSKPGKKGKTVFDKMMENGDTASYDADGPIYISLGRADFIDVTIDGVLIEDGNKSGGSRKLLLTPVEDGSAGTGTGTDGATGAGDAANAGTTP